MSFPESHNPLRAAQALKDKTYLQNHMTFSQMTLEELDKQTGKPRNLEGTSFIDLPSTVPENDELAVVVLTHFDGSEKDVYTRTAASYIHGALGKRYRLLALTHEHKGEPSLKVAPLDAHMALERLRKEDICSGNYASLTIPKIELLQDLGIKEAHLVGVQFGASLGASMVEVAANNPDIDVSTALLIEPPNVKKRPASELEHLLGPGTFFYPVQNTIERTGIRPLREGLKEFDRRLMRSVYRLHRAKRKYNILADSPEGQAILKGLGTSSFMDAITFQDVTEVTAVRASMSRIAHGFAEITNPNGTTYQTDEIDNEVVEPVIVPSVAHELVYDLPTIALLAKYSISKVQPQDLVY